MKKTIPSPKIMVFAAVGAFSIIGPFYLEVNVDGDFYLRLLKDDFYAEFSSLSNQFDLFFMIMPHCIGLGLLGIASTRHCLKCGLEDE